MPRVPTVSTWGAPSSPTARPAPALPQLLLAHFFPFAPFPFAPLPSPHLEPQRGWEPACALALGALQPGVAHGLSLGVSRSASPGTEQSQLVTFPPSTEPAFVTVPQRGFGEPFVLNPGTWALVVEAEGVLLVRRGLSGLERGPGRGPEYPPLALPARTTWCCCPARTTRQPSCSCVWPRPARSSLPPSALGTSEGPPGGVGGWPPCAQATCPC